MAMFKSWSQSMPSSFHLLRLISLGLFCLGFSACRTPDPPVEIVINPSTNAVEQVELPTNQPPVEAIVPVTNGLSLIPALQTVTGARAHLESGSDAGLAVKRLYVRETTGKPWAVELRHPLRQALLAGHTYEFTFDARTPPGAGYEDNYVEFVLYRGSRTDALKIQPVTVDDVWRPHVAHFRSFETIPVGKAVASIYAGAKKQVVALRNFQVEDLGSGVEAESLRPEPVSYPDRGTRAAWRDTAARRIRELRTAPFDIQVRDALGRPVAEASVTVRMLRSDFGFGGSLSPRQVVQPISEEEEKFVEQFPQLFNRVSFEDGFKWSQWENKKAAFLRTDLAAAIDWAESEGLQVRGGSLIWPCWERNNPPDLKVLDERTLAKRIQDHLTEMVSIHKGRVQIWDVVSEARHCNDFVEKLGERAYASWFKIARNADPGATYFLNEYGILNGSESVLRQFETLARDLKRDGAPISGVGLQGHFGRRLPGPQQVWAVLDRFEKLGLKVEVTEFDLDVEEEGCRADFTRDFLLALYSHPAATGITFWGPWSGRSWTRGGGLVNRDGSFSPSGEAYATLMEDWQTEILDVTDSQGRLKGMGHLGAYRVTVLVPGESKTREFALKRGAANQLTVQLQSKQEDILKRASTLGVNKTGRPANSGDTTPARVSPIKSILPPTQPKSKSIATVPGRVQSRPQVKGPQPIQNKSAVAAPARVQPQPAVTVPKRAQSQPAVAAPKPAESTVTTPKSVSPGPSVVLPERVLPEPVPAPKTVAPRPPAPARSKSVKVKPAVLTKPKAVPENSSPALPKIIRPAAQPSKFNPSPRALPKTLPKRGTAPSVTTKKPVLPQPVQRQIPASKPPVFTPKQPTILRKLPAKSLPRPVQKSVQTPTPSKPVARSNPLLPAVKKKQTEPAPGKPSPPAPLLDRARPSVARSFGAALVDGAPRRGGKRKRLEFALPGLERPATNSRQKPRATFLGQALDKSPPRSGTPANKNAAPSEAPATRP